MLNLRLLLVKRPDYQITCYSNPRVDVTNPGFYFFRLTLDILHTISVYLTVDTLNSENMVSISPRPIKSSSVFVESKDRLTKKERSFIGYFLQGNSAHKSALLAGYSPFTAEVANTVILNRPRVIAEIRRQSDELFQEKKVDKDWVLQRAYELADANMLDYLEIDENGRVNVDIRRCTRSMGAAIQELSYDPSGRLKIRLVDKKAAVELLARLKKMFDNSDESDRVNGNNPITLQTLDQIVQNVTINQQVNVIQPRGHFQLPEAGVDQ